MPDRPIPTFHKIDRAIIDMPEDVHRIELQMSWPEYRDLIEDVLRVRAPDASAIKSWGSEYEQRPLKSYRGYVLKYDPHGSQVLGYRVDGSIAARHIR